jgi:hypothetical protein
MTTSVRMTVALAIALIASACSKTASSSSPSAPTATVRTLSFASDSATAVGQSIGITLSSVQGPPGTIRLAIFGYNLKNDKGQGGSGNGVSDLCGRVKWDGTLLEQAAVPEAGDFLKQGGVAVTISGSLPSSQSLAGSTAGWCANRPPQAEGTLLQPGAFGNGEIVHLLLRPRDGVTTGTSSIQFIEGWEGYPQERVIIYPSGGVRDPNRFQSMDHYYDGTITIR